MHILAAGQDVCSIVCVHYLLDTASQEHKDFALSKGWGGHIIGLLSPNYGSIST